MELEAPEVPGGDSFFSNCVFCFEFVCFSWAEWRRARWRIQLVFIRGASRCQLEGVGSIRDLGVYDQSFSKPTPVRELVA